METAAPSRFDSVSRIAVARWRDGMAEDCTDDVAAEVPVALEYNGISHAVMLASPADLEDFALGFSLTEGILRHPGELYDIELRETEDGIQLQMQISSERFAQLKEHRRSMAGRTGCGLCGAENLKQVIRPVPPVETSVRLSSQALHAALHQLQARQQLQRITGAAHAAAWLDGDGAVTCLREDVGRHNALDKLIGALSARSVDFRCGAVLVTSRASYEMVHKTASVGAGLLAAISAPTALAIRMAEQLNVTLVGFVRNGGHAVYSNPQRLLA